MPRFNANLTLLFNEVDFLERFRAAKDAGFTAVEYLFPYAHRKQDLAERLQSNGLTQVLHNLPAGDWARGERGIACLPDRVGEFQDGVGTAIDYAQTLQCTQLNCLAGITPAGVDAAKVRDTLVSNLQFAAGALKRAGIRLLVEPCNTRDMPGFYLNRSQQAIDLMDAVGSDNLYLQYDIYHMQVMEGNLAPTIERHFDRIRHLQLADNPGRHEPGTGEINYPFLFDVIDRLGYSGWIGCEYKPANSTVQGLGWIAPYLHNAGSMHE
jgi:hydroxypyruvate isomerase